MSREQRVGNGITPEDLSRFIADVVELHEMPVNRETDLLPLDAASIVALDGLCRQLTDSSSTLIPSGYKEPVAYQARNDAEIYFPVSSLLAMRQQWIEAATDYADNT